MCGIEGLLLRVVFVREDLGWFMFPLNQCFESDIEYAMIRGLFCTLQMLLKILLHF